MEPVHSPDPAREIASFRQRLVAFRYRTTSLATHSAYAGLHVRQAAHQRKIRSGKPEPDDVPETVWSDTRWTDTVFDSGP